ncbi:hypothetical protein B0G57_11276 [Trinickia symbiotica]|nr:hypothetical protein B0G57_11276 [Trinickia symbiotica]
MGKAQARFALVSRVSFQHAGGACHFCTPAAGSIPIFQNTFTGTVTTSR